MTTETPIWFQKLFYKETVLAIKSSLDFLTYEGFKNDLSLLLPQESKKSRIRIANNILHRFFPDNNLYNLLTQTWEIYRDEQLLQEIIRYELLNQEPVIAKFVLTEILTRKQDEIIPNNIFKKYIKDTYKKENENLTWWLQGAVRDLGFITKTNINWQICSQKPSSTALLLLMHKIYAPYPVEIDINVVLNGNFWKYTGIRSSDAVKDILYKAKAYNLINIDDNKIKTLHPLENLLALKPDLD